MKPLLRGYFGDEVVCLMPRPVRKELNSLLLKGGSLLLMISLGVPSTLNSSMRWSFKLAKLVLLT